MTEQTYTTKFTPLRLETGMTKARSAKKMLTAKAMIGIHCSLGDMSVTIPDGLLLFSQSINHSPYLHLDIVIAPCRGSLELVKTLYQMGGDSLRTTVKVS